LVQSCPPKFATEAHEAVGDRPGARLQGRLRDDDRVDGAHLGVDRDRHRPSRRPVVDRASAGGRAGEADAGDAGMVDERLADLHAGGQQVGEGPRRQPGLLDRRADLGRDQLAGARMGGMALDHDGAARGEGGRGVAARGREGEREVARAEHRHGPDRHEHPPHVRARDRRGRGIGGVDDRLDVVAGVEHGGEGLELAAGPLELGAQARLRQPRLRARGRHDRVAGGAQARGGGAEERRSRRAVAQGGRGEGVDGGGDRRVDVGGARLVVRGDGRAGARIDGIERRRHALYGTGSSAEPVFPMIQFADRTTWAPLDRPQRYERIAARLVGDIRAGRLAPGDRLPSERELARRLAVGRASVREALAALALDGVLETRPGSGSFVAADAAARLAARRPPGRAAAGREPVRPAGDPHAAGAARGAPGRARGAS
jgi:DNA-binding transcriptional regulator YhcF (GntR family)